MINLLPNLNHALLEEFLSLDGIRNIKLHTKESTGFNYPRFPQCNEESVERSE